MTTEEVINTLKSRASTGHPEENCSDFSFGAPIQTVNEALEMAIDALRAQQERENPKPLTLDELRQMDGEPVWVCSAKKNGVIPDRWMLLAGFRPEYGVFMFIPTAGLAQGY